MKKFEYRTELISCFTSESELLRIRFIDNLHDTLLGNKLKVDNALLQTLGSEGWEMVGTLVNGSLTYGMFKREILD